MNDPATSRVLTLRAALKHLHWAVGLLDQTDAPEHIGAHADLAAHHLREWLDSIGESNEGPAT